MSVSGSGGADHDVGDAAGLVPPVVVRSMRVSDVQAVVDIETETFSSPWQSDTFESLIDRPGVELLVMVSEHEGVIGYAVLWCVLDQGELANVAISSRWRGFGLGSRLLGHVIESARSRGIAKVFLEVRVSNERAARMYEAFGFEQVGVRRAYYTQPSEDARILMLELT